MSGDAFVLTIVAVLPVVFILLWLAVGALMARITGWSRLEELYPDRSDEPFLERFFFQALYVAKPGAKGPGMSYRGCVTIAACNSGLRISIWKAFQPFSKPIFLPWEVIEAVAVKVTGFKMCGLKVGREDPFQLSIIARVARQIDRVTGGKLELPDDLKSQV